MSMRCKKYHFSILRNVNRGERLRYLQKELSACQPSDGFTTILGFQKVIKQRKVRIHISTIFLAKCADIFSTDRRVCIVHICKGNVAKNCFKAVQLT